MLERPVTEIGIKGGQEVAFAVGGLGQECAGIAHRDLYTIGRGLSGERFELRELRPRGCDLSALRGDLGQRADGPARLHALMDRITDLIDPPEALERVRGLSGAGIRRGPCDLHERQADRRAVCGTDLLRPRGQREHGLLVAANAGDHGLRRQTRHLRLGLTRVLGEPHALFGRGRGDMPTAPTKRRPRRQHQGLGE